MTWPSRHIAISIDASPDAVIAVAGDPTRLPEWAAGLSSGIRRAGDRWITDSPMGPVDVSFVGPIPFGILDHDVTLPDGAVVHNPLRVVPNDSGSEVIFTLFQRPGMTAADVEADAEAVTADLVRLKAILEA